MVTAINTKGVKIVQGINTTIHDVESVVFGEVQEQTRPDGRGYVLRRLKITQRLTAFEGGGEHTHTVEHELTLFGDSQEDLKVLV